MPRKRVTIEVQDDDGTTYQMKVSGEVTREKVQKIFDTMGLLNIENEPDRHVPDSVGAKIWALVDRHYPTRAFTSSNILEKFEDDYNKPIKLSVISTYLSRFSERGLATRRRHGREWVYHAVPAVQPPPGLR